jgi:hypothetical protein
VRIFATGRTLAFPVKGNGREEAIPIGASADEDRGCPAEYFFKPNCVIELGLRGERDAAASPSARHRAVGRADASDA